MVHIKEVAGTGVVISRLSPADADLQSWMFSLPWHFLLLPKITVVLSIPVCFSSLVFLQGVLLQLGIFWQWQMQPWCEGKRRTKFLL